MNHHLRRLTVLHLRDVNASTLPLACSFEQRSFDGDRKISRVEFQSDVIFFLSLIENANIF